MSENHNRIVTDKWSNPASEALYKSGWKDAPLLKEQYENGDQCGGCSFFALFNGDWGLCAYAKSPYYLETVFEHFTCPVFVREHWGPHSFRESEEFHCRCGGHSSEYWDNIVKNLKDSNKDET